MIEVEGEEVSFTPDLPGSIPVTIRNGTNSEALIRARTTHPTHIVTKPPKLSIPPMSSGTFEVVYKAQVEPKLEPDIVPRIQFLWNTPEGTETGKKLKVRFIGATPQLTKTSSTVTARPQQQQQQQAEVPQLPPTQPPVPPADPMKKVTTTTSTPPLRAVESPQLQPTKQSVASTSNSSQYIFNPLVNQSQEDSSSRNSSPLIVAPAMVQIPPVNVPKQSNVQVFIRMRPFLASVREDQTPYWTIGSESTTIADSEVTFEFDYVVPPTGSNLDVYNKVNVAQFVNLLFNGINGTIFVYGQTCSGKTHTMFGHEDSEIGIVQHLVNAIFKMKHTLPGCKIMSSFFEIYNEEVFDLLTDVRANRGLKVCEDKARGFVVQNLSEVRVEDATACMRLLMDGAANRKFGLSHLNDRSSRSHTTFRIECISEDPLLKQTKRAVLHMVDLAGSETLMELGSATQRRETSHINVSLSHLKHLITELSNGEKFVNYRNSVLTKILKQSLGGNSKTIMICTVTPSVEFRKETKSTLRFGTLAKAIKNDVTANVVTDNNTLKDENAKLRAKVLSMQDQINELEKINHSLVAVNVPPQQPTGGNVSGSLSSKEAAEYQRKIAELERMIMGLHEDKKRQQEQYDRKLDDMRSEIAEDRKTHEMNLMQSSVRGDELRSVLRKDERIDNVLSQIISYLMYGCKVQRCTPTGQVKAECLFLSPDKTTIHCCTTTKEGEPARTNITESILLKSLAKVILGQYTKALQHAVQSESFHRSMTLQAAGPLGGKALDLIFYEETDFEAWTVALNALCKSTIEWGDSLDVTTLQGNESLLPEETQFCAKMHIPPLLYLSAKSDILTRNGAYVTLFDIRTITALDLFHAAKLLAFFVERQWVQRKNLFVITSASQPSVKLT